MICWLHLLIMISILWCFYFLRHFHMINLFNWNLLFSRRGNRLREIKCLPRVTGELVTEPGTELGTSYYERVEYSGLTLDWRLAWFQFEGRSCGRVFFSFSSFPFFTFFPPSFPPSLAPSLPPFLSSFFSCPLDRFSVCSLGWPQSFCSASWVRGILGIHLVRQSVWACGIVKLSCYYIYFT